MKNRKKNNKEKPISQQTAREVGKKFLDELKAQGPKSGGKGNVYILKSGKQENREQVDKNEAQDPNPDDEEPVISGTRHLRNLRAEMINEFFGSKEDYLEWKKGRKNDEDKS